MKRLIVRFEKQDDLDIIAKKLGLERIDKNTKQINFPSLKIKIKKDVANKSKKEEYWKSEWFDMPEYISEKQEVFSKIEFLFDGEEFNLDLIENIFEQKITQKTTSIWFPKLVSGKHSKLRVVGGNKFNRYPIYVVSKNRSDKCYTSRYLSQMEVEHYVVVEPQDIQAYKSSVENKYAKILELNMKYKEEYDTFDNLGDSKSKGPGGARNFCWEHSISEGFDWHWVMDDNATEGFHYMNNNMKQKCRTGSIFAACEDFVDRYTNIAIGGLNYSMFCKMSDKTPAFVMNTRIYSFLLIRNNIPYRWRGRYNEDTDLSLRVLKDGWCTVQFNSFLAGKCTTQKIKGGNTEEFYSHEGTLPKSKMLEEMHPDVSKVVWKFNRWHHHVDYSGFSQKLILKDEYTRTNTINNYGMIVIDTEENNTFDTKSYLEEKYKIKNLF